MNFNAIEHKVFDMDLLSIVTDSEREGKSKKADGNYTGDALKSK